MNTKKQVYIGAAAAAGVMCLLLVVADDSQLRHRLGSWWLQQTTFSKEHAPHLYAAVRRYELATRPAAGRTISLGKSEARLPRAFAAEQNDINRLSVYQRDGAEGSIAVMADQSMREQARGDLARFATHPAALTGPAFSSDRAFFKALLAAPHAWSPFSDTSEFARAAFLITLREALVSHFTPIQHTATNAMEAYQFGEAGRLSRAVLEVFDAHGGHHTVYANGLTQEEIDAFLASIE